MSTREHSIISLSNTQAKSYAKNATLSSVFNFSRLSSVQCKKETLLLFSERLGCPRFQTMNLGPNFNIDHENMNSVININCRLLEIRGKIRCSLEDFKKFLNNINDDITHGHSVVLSSTEAATAFTNLFMLYADELDDESIPRFNPSYLRFEYSPVITTTENKDPDKVDAKERFNILRPAGKSYKKADEVVSGILKSVGVLGFHVSDHTFGARPRIRIKVDSSIFKYITLIDDPVEVREKIIEKLVDLIKNCTLPTHEELASLHNLNSIKHFNADVKSPWYVNAGTYTTCDLLLVDIELSIDSTYLRPDIKLDGYCDANYLRMILGRLSSKYSGIDHVPRDTNKNDCISVLSLVDMYEAVGSESLKQIDTFVDKNREVIAKSISVFKDNCRIAVNKLSDLACLFMNDRSLLTNPNAEPDGAVAISLSERLATFSCTVECPDVIDSDFINDNLIPNVSGMLSFNGPTRVLNDVNSDEFTTCDHLGNKVVKASSIELKGLKNFRGISFQASNVNFDKLKEEEITDLIKSIRGNRICLKAAFNKNLGMPLDDMIAGLFQCDPWSSKSIKLVSSDFCNIKSSLIETIIGNVVNDNNLKGLLDLKLIQRDAIDSIEKHYIKNIGFTDKDEGSAYVLFDYYVTERFYMRASDFVKSGDIYSLNHMHLDRFANKGRSVKLVSELSKSEIRTVIFNGKSRTTNDVIINIMLPSTCRMEKGAANLLQAYHQSFTNPLDIEAGKRVLEEHGEEALKALKRTMLNVIKTNTNLNGFCLSSTFAYDNSMVRAGSYKHGLILLGFQKDGIPAYNNVKYLAYNPKELDSLKAIYSDVGLEFKNDKFLDEKFCKDSANRYVRAVRIDITGNEDLNKRKVAKSKV